MQLGGMRQRARAWVAPPADALAVLEGELWAASALRLGAMKKAMMIQEAKETCPETGGAIVLAVAGRIRKTRCVPGPAEKFSLFCFDCEVRAPKTPLVTKIAQGNTVRVADVAGLRVPLLGGEAAAPRHCAARWPGPRPALGRWRSPRGVWWAWDA